MDNKQGYDIWSAFYDTKPNPTIFMDELSFPPLWSSVTGQRVLEVGCGTGRHTVKLARQKNEVTAIDLSGGMLDVARSKKELAGVQFLEGDFLDIPFPKAGFDMVIGALVLEHVRELGRFF